MTGSSMGGTPFTEWEFVEWLCRFDGKPIKLEGYQQEFLQDRSRFRWICKSRQVGFSFTFALEALTRCHLRNGHTSIFVSYNQDDAKEKVMVARQLFDELHNRYRKRLVGDSKTELVFEPTSGRGPVSRIISVPSKAPRGKRGDVYLDELAHYGNDRDVYRGTTALIVRDERSQLTGCSTPLGQRGIFWEIATEQLRPYPDFSRLRVPWWECRFFCRDVRRAHRAAPTMPTQERVATFGLPPLREQYESLSAEEFEEEFEAVFRDETGAFFNYDLILPCTSEDVELAADFYDVPRPKGRLVAGYDVGRVNDPSALAVFEEDEGRYTCRMLKTYKNVPYDEQGQILRQLLELLPISRLSIDATGGGAPLAEGLRGYSQVQAETFSQSSKFGWVTNFRQLLERRTVVLPRDRSLVTEIHAIEHSTSKTRLAVFDSPPSRRGHADRFWAIVLACQKERPRRPYTIITARIIGGDKRPVRRGPGWDIEWPE